ncbi:MAG: cupin, partial [Oscillospiraceae bacterium]|nr:cupin [Oscillospiraceae bacterium]
MKAPEHRIFSIAVENAAVPGCTVSELVSKENGYYILHFSLAAGTSISAETYQYPKLWLVADGEMEAFTEQGATPLKAGDLYATLRGVPVGVRAKESCVYTEITLKEDSIMNEIIKDGAVFALKDLLPTQADKIVNMDIINDEKLKFVV